MEIGDKLRALSGVAERLNREGVTYAVGASAMLYLRGIADSFNDIDLTVALEDAPRAEAVLRSLGTMAPPEQHVHYLTRCFLEFEVEGVEVDLIAGMVIESNGVAHDCPLRPEDIDETAVVNGTAVPLHSLACWKRYYTLMGRAEKAALIDRAADSASKSGEANPTGEQKP